MKSKRQIKVAITKSVRNISRLMDTLFRPLRKLKYLSIGNWLEMQREKGACHDYVDFDKYANLKRVLHEERVKMDNSSFGSVKIDWGYLGEVLKQKKLKKDYKSKYRFQAIQSSYFPIIDKRFNHK